MCSTTVVVTPFLVFCLFLVPNPHAMAVVASGLFSLAENNGMFLTDSSLGDVVLKQESSLGHRLLFGVGNSDRSALRISSNAVSMDYVAVSNDVRILTGVTIGSLHRSPRFAIDVLGETIQLASSNGANATLRVSCADSNMSSNTNMSVASIVCRAGTDTHTINSNEAVWGCSEDRKSFWRYNDSDRIVVDRNGYVGIGTADPTELLHVQGDVRVQQHIYGSNMTLSGDLTVMGDYTIINTDVRVTDQLDVVNMGTGPALRVTQLGPEAIAEFYDDNSNIAVSIVDGGNVGIGTLSPQYKLHVQGGDVYATGEMLMSSDVRLKAEIRVIRDALVKVKQIGGYTFTKLGRKERSAGVLAQEVQLVLPEVVHTDVDGYMCVSYGNMVALLVEAIKDMSMRLEAVEKYVEDSKIAHS